MDQNAHGMDWFNMFNGNRWTIDGNHGFPQMNTNGIEIVKVEWIWMDGFQEKWRFQAPQNSPWITDWWCDPPTKYARYMLEKCWKIRWLKSRTKSTQIWVKLIFQHISTQNVVITQHVWMKLLLSPKRQWRIQPIMILIGQRNLNKIGFTFTPAGQWTRKDFWRIYALHWDCFEF